MAINDITRPRAHLKLCGYTCTRNNPYHYYRRPNFTGYTSYRCGTWNSSDKGLSAILNKLTRRPKRHRNRKLTVCEAMIRMAGGTKSPNTPNFWRVNDVNVWYIDSANHWTTNKSEANGNLVNRLNKEMITS